MMENINVHSIMNIIAIWSVFLLVGIPDISGFGNNALLSHRTIFSRTINSRNVAIQSNSFAGCTQLTMCATKPKKSELNGDYLWRLNIALEKPGYKSSTAVCRVRFVPDRNYEPPQGKVFIEDDYNGVVKVDDKGYAGIWTLSEDKNDRKDGLWVWGLFEEPKYPFLYFFLGENGIFFYQFSI